MNVELRMWTAKLAVPEGRQSNFELVARRAMKNYSIKNYLASYSIFLLVSPSLLGFLSPGNGGTEGGIKTIEDGRGFFIASSHPSLTAQTFSEKNHGTSCL